MLFMFLVIIFPWHQPHPLLYFIVRSRIFLPHLAASLVYLHAAIYQQASWINGVAWTLEIEVQFYLLLPLLAELFRIRHTRLRRAILTSLVLASALISQFLVQPSGIARLNLSLPLHFFIAGVLLADIYLETPRILRLGPLSGDALTLLTGGLLVYVLHWKPTLAWVEPYLIIGFCLAIFRGAWASRLFKWGPLAIPGAMCYTIYLYHSFVVQHLMPVTLGIVPAGHALWLEAAVQFALMLLPVLVVSAVLFRFTEKPFMILSHEVARRLRAPRVEVVAGA
jgi:peptidoglycan/LPS O-acetylase OafA/YrhL